MSYEEEKQDRKIERLEAEIERMRGFETAARDLSNDLTRVAKERDELQEANTNFAFQASDQAQEIERLRTRESGLEQRLEWTIRDGFKKQEEQVAKIKELKADLEQSEEIKRLKDELENYGDHYACLLISKDAQIKELEGMLSIRTEELDIAHSAARSEKEMHEKELAAFARRIKELEDALVEKQTALMPSAPRCYADARRQAAIEQLQAEGKIGPDAAKPQSWQITDERKATLAASLKVLERLKKNNTDTDHSYLDRGITVLRAMLEAGL